MKLHHTLLGAALAISLPAAALAAEGAYVGVGAGVNLQPNLDLESDTLPDGEVDTETGFAGILTGGYKFGFGLRTELELGYRRNRIDDIRTTPTLGDDNNGDLRQLSLMANVLYDINTGTAFTPYIGAGIGGVRAWADSVDVADIDDSDTALAYQGIVGVAYSVNPNLDLTLDYRYFASRDLDFSIGSGGTASIDNKNHTVLAGLRYTFGAAAAAPVPVAAPAPAPVPPPAPVQAQRDFMVFFDFDKSDITPVASRTISDAAAAAGTTRAIRLDVTGHTDTSGSPSYNMRLSQRRAEAVKAELVRLGVPARNVTVAWKGESQPLVATADGVREPSNRRAQIVLVVQ